jgi:hypothetical protein
MTNVIKHNQTNALQWISSLLKKHQIPFLVCGGLAAIGYGSRRKLNDIDLFVPTEYFKRVVNLGMKYISKPARHYRESSEGWELEYAQFIYHGVKIEIGNPDGAKIYDRACEQWTPLKLDFSAVESKLLSGIEIPLICRKTLIEYKIKLGRPVDLLDIEAMIP